MGLQVHVPFMCPSHRAQLDRCQNAIRLKRPKVLYHFALMQLNSCLSMLNVITLIWRQDVYINTKCSYGNNDLVTLYLFAPL